MTISIESGMHNDIVLDRYGNVSMVSGLAAVVCNCKTAMQAQRGEMMYTKGQGMPTLATAWDDYNPVQFEAAARTIIRAVPGVIEVKSFSLARADSTLAYTAVIVTIYGRGIVNG